MIHSMLLTKSHAHFPNPNPNHNPNTTRATIPSRQTQGAAMVDNSAAKTDDTLDVVLQIACAQKYEADWFDEVRNVPKIPLQLTGTVDAHTLCSFSRLAYLYLVLVATCSQNNMLFRQSTTN